jgi:hypothetical protein
VSTVIANSAAGLTQPGFFRARQEFTALDVNPCSP